MKKLILVTIILGFLAQTAPAAFFIELENDMLNKTDQYYTHGTRFMYDINERWRALAGQNMYTPTDISISTPLTNERPYAGTLYFGGIYHKRTNKITEEIELSVGAVGDYSFAGDAQSWIHDVFDNQNPEGWDNQIKPWVYLQARYRGECNLPFDKYALFVPYTEVNLGSVFDYVGVGMQTIVGYNVAKPSSTPIISKSTDFSVGLLFEVFIKTVFYNHLIEGDNYADIDVTPTTFVLDTRYGILVKYKNIGVKYIQTIRTKEYIEQDKNAKFGSVIISLDI